MRPLELAKMKCGVSLCCAALGLSTSWIALGVPNAWTQVSPTPKLTGGPEQSESLKGKSNEELVRLLVGGKSARKLEDEARRANEVKTHLPERFWEMPPKDAALALVQDNCNLKLKPLLKISVREDKRPLPRRGRVELRSEGGYWSMAWESLLILSSDGMRSTLEFSSIELHGPVKRSVIERALRQTRHCALPTEEAQRIYEVIRWLGRIQFARPEQASGTYETSRIIASHSVRGKLSVEPGGPHKREFTLCPAPLSECYYEAFDDDLYAGFVRFILRETLKRHGVDLDETTTAELGEETFSSSEEKFVYTSKPPPPSDPGTAKWIDRMLRNLEKYPSGVTSRLASIDEPLRYPDSRIDDALFRLLRHGLSPQALNRKTDERGFNDATDAARRLAGRKRADAFPIIMQLLQVRNDNVSNAQNDLLEAATLLASTKPEYRQQLVEYLTAQLQGLENTPHFTSRLFDSVWRGDLRELTPLLEKMAAASPDEIEDDLGWTTPPRRVAGNFHGARRILLSWRESDPLTKLKLDAIIEASAGYFGKPAEILARGFAALSEGERQGFTEFVRWLEEYKPNEVHTSWDPASVAEIVTGHVNAGCTKDGYSARDPNATRYSGVVSGAKPWRMMFSVTTRGTRNWRR